MSEEPDANDFLQGFLRQLNQDIVRHDVSETKHQLQIREYQQQTFAFLDSLTEEQLDSLRTIFLGLQILSPDLVVSMLSFYNGYIGSTLIYKFGRPVVPPLVTDEDLSNITGDDPL